MVSASWLPGVGHQLAVPPGRARSRRGPPRRGHLRRGESAGQRPVRHRGRGGRSSQAASSSAHGRSLVGAGRVRLPSRSLRRCRSRSARSAPHPSRLLLTSRLGPFRHALDRAVSVDGGGWSSTPGASAGGGREPRAAPPPCARAPVGCPGCTPGTGTSSSPGRAGRSGPRRPRCRRDRAEPSMSDRYHLSAPCPPVCPASWPRSCGAGGSPPEALMVRHRSARGPAPHHANAAQATRPMTTTRAEATNR